MKNLPHSIPGAPATPQVTATNGGGGLAAADSQLLLDAIYAAATDHAIITTDRDRIVLTWNSGAEILFGYRTADIVGHSADCLFTEEDQASGVPQSETDAAAGSGRAADYRWHRRQDGSRFWGDSVMTPIAGAENGVRGFLKILRDATAKKRAEMALLHLAGRDSLTGLPNRSAFPPHLLEACAYAQRNHQMVLLLLLDLDKFKDINDTWGHQAGDAFLQHAARRMRDATRDTDFIARLGGDEFVIIQPARHGPSDGAILADKLTAAFAAPFDIDGHVIAGAVSIGITVYPLDGEDGDRLLKNADLAVYEVKKRGGGGYQYFTDRLDRDAHQRSNDLAALRQAVASRNFCLEYQPQICAVSGKMLAVEALLRCNEPVLRDYPIDRVIEMAIGCDLVVDIGLWMMREACIQLREWRDAGLPCFRMCINLCTKELLTHGLPDYIDQLLAQNGLQGDDLEVEITERQLLEQGSSGVAALLALRQRQVSTALDDFGTGYSSLAYLRDLPVDRVKLDQSFVTRIPEDSDSCAIASAIIQLVHTLRREMVIEGVESAEQAAFFRTLGSESLQGFYFSKPLPADQLASWFEA